MLILFNLPGTERCKFCVSFWQSFHNHPDYRTMFMQSVDYTGSNLLITHVSQVSPVTLTASDTTRRKYDPV